MDGGEPMIYLAEALVDQIEDFIDVETCQPERVFVSAGEPAVGSCGEIAVWISNVSDANIGISDCMVDTQVELTYRISWCYPEPEDGSGPTTAQELTAAECLYELMDAVWCGLVSERDAGTLLIQSSCEKTSLGQLTVDPRSGGVVTATGTVTVDYDCVKGS